MSYILVGSWPYIHNAYSRPGAVHTHDQAHVRSRDQAHACTSWRSCSWAVTARRSCSWSWAADGRFVCHIQTRPGPRELRAPGRRAGAAGAQLARSCRKNRPRGAPIPPSCPNNATAMGGFFTTQGLPKLVRARGRAPSLGSRGRFLGGMGGFFLPISVAPPRRFHASHHLKKQFCRLKNINQKPPISYPYPRHQAAHANHPTAPPGAQLRGLVQLQLRQRLIGRQTISYT